MIRRLLSLTEPAVIAHRGGSKLRPENTLAAFDHAASLGVDGLECDVHLSRDGEPVVIHDPTLDRTTDASGPVSALTADELARVDAGYRFGEAEAEVFFIPGHTSGHIAYAFREQRALFCGDSLHHPLQVYAPHWNSRFCELPAQALVTRRRLLEHCAEQGALLFPVHFGAPHVGAITDDAAGFALRFVDGRGL